MENIFDYAANVDTAILYLSVSISINNLHANVDVISDYFNAYLNN